MHASGAPAPSAGPGWYPDPAGSGSHRYWDGTRWTDALSSAIAPAGPNAARDDSRNFALAAHLSAPLSLFVGFPFLGPLVIYLVKKDDPFVRAHAAEALNFTLSIMLGIATFVLIFFIGGLLLIPLLIALGVAWIVFVGIAAVKAGEGAAYRYPLTIRFVR